MAYRQNFNPDSLPAFAEPERKHSNNTPSSSSAPQYNQPPLQHQQSYSKPAPPLPTDYQAGGRRLSPQGPPHGYGTPPPNRGYASPPPGQYGTGRPGPGGRAPPMSRPPPSPAPPAGADPALWPLFKAVDKDGTGNLTERELRAALVNGDWTSFDPHTVKMMIRMFDTDRSGTIGFEEFCGLWGFLAAWRSLFDRFDTDRSGNISLDEYTNALVAFGYRLSPQFVDTLFRTYDKRGESAISFDLFVQSCISLKRMTDVFKKYDDDRDGYITLSFEDFLTEIIRQK
ncbi:sorcin [Acephala macrosclerotiorum]|nr:sorcin [Acephala macrosclerotiorum]